MVEFSFTIGTGGAWAHGNLIKEPMLQESSAEYPVSTASLNGVMASQGRSKLPISDLLVRSFISGGEQNCKNASSS